MTIQKYARADSVEAAYELISQSPENAVIGGMTALKLAGRDIGVAVDLLGLGLDYISEEGRVLRIGATSPLRSIELSEPCARACSGIIAAAVSRIGGVQLRNHATLGGSVLSMWSVSDTVATLLAVDAELEFYRTGSLSLESFLERPVRRDILTEIRIPDIGLRCAQEAIRISYLDFPLLTVAVAAREQEARIVVGARPGRAVLAKEAMCLFSQGANPREAGVKASEELDFGDDQRTSAWYRKRLCAVLVERSLNEAML
jgi:CO/xanthine dehydrogenase FAD-binding subunit